MPTGAPLTVAQASVVLGISEIGIYQLIQRKQLPTLRSREGQMFVPHDHVVGYARAVAAQRAAKPSRPAVSAEQARVRFELRSGQSPEWFADRWVSDELPELEGNRRFAATALALTS